MERKLTPSEYTTEELLNALESEETLSDKQELILYPSLKTDIPAFLSAYEIQPGDDPVPQRTLYELYKLWSKDSISRFNFEYEISKYLISNKISNKRFYLINQSALKLSKAAYQFVLEKTIDRTKSPTWKRHFDNFTAKYNLKPGKHYLESYVLYDLYDQYIFEIKKKAPLGEQQFFNFCKLYFPDHKLTETRAMWFGVDESIKSFITDERLKQLRENRVTNVKKQKAKNKKKRRKISSIKTRVKSKNSL